MLLSNVDPVDLFLRARSEAWAILPDALQMLLMQPAAVAPAELIAITRPGAKGGRVAHVKIIGPISKRESFWSMFFGGTSVEGITKALREAGGDETVGTVLLEFDSPGGTVSGMADLAAEVRRLRETKTVVALANNLMASAAYWVGSQADEIVATPDALVDS